MNPMSDEAMKFGIVLSQYLARVIGINLIIGGPIVVALSQIGLSIREIAINSRKDYDSDQSDYKSLEWIATIFMYIGWIMIPVGIIFVLRSIP